MDQQPDQASRLLPNSADDLIQEQLKELPEERKRIQLEFEHPRQHDQPRRAELPAAEYEDAASGSLLIHHQHREWKHQQG